MPRTWLSVRVELLGGRGEDLWPYPGRVLVVGPSHTFADLAEAIDDAFARWDRSHLCQFTLADGTVVTDEETGEDELSTPFGPIPKTSLVLTQAKVMGQVEPGDEFRYVFDFGDGWTHACTVEAEKVDAIEVLGMRPSAPTSSWGWGSIPDQYGRRWDGDDGERSMPRRPRTQHPMLRHDWPKAGPGEPVDLRELRGAIVRRDVPDILGAIEGREVDDLLQHIGMGVQVLLSAGAAGGDVLGLSVVNRLEERGWVGDDILAEDLLAQLQGTILAARRLPVDLSELVSELAGGPDEVSGYLDLQTGEIVPGVLVDPMYADADDLVDVESDPDRWLELVRPGSHARWQDMADFAGRQTSTDLRRRLESAIDGRGAFRRFRNVVDEEDLVDGWRRFSDDRDVGRARAYLAGEGIRALPQA